MITTDKINDLSQEIKESMSYTLENSSLYQDTIDEAVIEKMNELYDCICSIAKPCDCGLLEYNHCVKCGGTLD